jgi:hypothetical protein
MPTITANTSAQVTLPAGQYINGIGAGVALVGTGGAGADPLNAGDAWQIGPFLTQQTVHLTAYTLLDYDIRSPLAAPPVGLTTAQTAAAQALVLEAGTLWANLPAPTAFRGLIYVSDVGINGSLWRSNGTIWSLVGGSCVLGQSSVAVSCTASTAEEVLASVNLQPGVMGVNGALRLTTLWTLTGAVGTKTLRARLGTTALGGSQWIAIVRAALALDYVAPIPQVLRNRNVANSQVTFFAAQGGIGTNTASGITAFTEDTSVATIVGITGQKATAGEVLTLEGYTLELLR